MAGILTIGGPDQVKVEQIFPSTQKTFIYNFGEDITGWSFVIDHQTLVLDAISFDRSGTPTFDNSQVIGYFDKQIISGEFEPLIVDATAGQVKIYIPADMYTGPIVPDARQNVPVTVVGVTWQDANLPPQINTHRWVFIQNWEPGVTAGDPTLATGYTALTLG